jgi:hypothetical protein
MANNRIRQYFPIRHATAMTENTPAQTTNGPVVPQGFVVCPPQLALANAAQQEIYRLAYERAKAAVQMPRHHRLLFSVWN